MHFKTLLLILLLSGSALQGQEVKISIAATSDVHGAIFPYDFLNDTPGSPSLASVAAFADSVRSVPGTNLLLLDNGDLIQGTPAAYYANFVQKKRRNLFSRVLNHIGYDAATVGNHDIEAGPEVYYRLKDEFDFPWLGANITHSGTGLPAFSPYTILEREGIRIAILGLITPGVPNWLPETLWPDLEFGLLVESAAKWVSVIREKESPDAIVGLFHTGMGTAEKPSEDIAENAGLMIAMNVPGLDLIITGHDHRARAETIVTSPGSEVLILNPGSGTRGLAFAELFFSRDENQKIILSSKRGEIISLESTSPDRTFIRKFRKDFRSVRKFANKPAGFISSPLSAREGLFGNSGFTDLIHKIQLRHTGAQISFTAPLTVNQNLDAGEILVRDLFKLYRYENYLYVMELTGKEVRNFLEYSYGLWFNHMKSEDDHLLNFRKDVTGQIVRNQNGTPGLMHPSFNFDSAAGIRYDVDVSQPVGHRVKIYGFENGEPFHENEIYRVAINSYRGSGGGGHLTSGAGIEHAKLGERIVYTSESDIRSHMIEYFRNHPRIDPRPGNNWKLVPENRAEKGQRKDLEAGF